MSITKVCKNTGEAFIIDDMDLEFYNKMGVPTPTLCPSERAKRRMAWRNERVLYERKCSATGADLISIYRPNTPFPVYKNEYWWGDKWDAKDYGFHFDFTKPFFEQFKMLLDRVPQAHTSVAYKTMENSLYCNEAGFLKNCYLCFEAAECQDCYFCDHIYYSRDCVDSDNTAHSELCYECNFIENCYDCKYVFNSVRAVECLFCYDVKNCSNCFGCVNLRNKQYYFMNEKLTKDEYEMKIKGIDMSSKEQLDTLVSGFSEYIKQKDFPVKYIHGNKNEDCTGDYLQNTSSVKDSFDCYNVRDARCIIFSSYSKDCYDCFVLHENCELCYEIATMAYNCYNCSFCKDTTSSSNLQYCSHCIGCQDCFGCIGLKKQQYCIFNKQYSKEDYEALKAKIIAHMTETNEYGEFFPIDISPFCYNETIAQEYYPMTKEACIDAGYYWQDDLSKAYNRGTNYTIPDKINDVKDDILEAILTCKVSQKNYNVKPFELSFYRKMGLPIPTKHPDIRHLERLSLRTGRVLYNTECIVCQVKLVSPHSPDTTKNILCQACYDAQIG